jgi:hypothetical protein
MNVLWIPVGEEARFVRVGNDESAYGTVVQLFETNEIVCHPRTFRLKDRPGGLFKLWRLVNDADQPANRLLDGVVYRGSLAIYMVDAEARPIPFSTFDEVAILDYVSTVVVLDKGQ